MTMIPLPTVSELIATALVFTDFTGEIAPSNTARETYRAATIATNLAAEAWEEANGQPVGATVPDDIRNAVALGLVAYADALNRRTEAEDAADALFARQCGDVDRDGRAVPLPFYVSAA